MVTHKCIPPLTRTTEDFRDYCTTICLTPHRGDANIDTNINTNTTIDTNTNTNINTNIIRILLLILILLILILLILILILYHKTTILGGQGRITPYNKYMDTYVRTNSGCGKTEAHINWSMVTCKMATPVAGTVLGFTDLGQSAVNAIGMYLRDPKNLGLTRWRMAV